MRAPVFIMSSLVVIGIWKGTEAVFTPFKDRFGFDHQMFTDDIVPLLDNVVKRMDDKVIKFNKKLDKLIKEQELDTMPQTIQPKLPSSDKFDPDLLKELVGPPVK